MQFNNMLRTLDFLKRLLGLTALSLFKVGKRPSYFYGIGKIGCDIRSYEVRNMNNMVEVG